MSRPSTPIFISIVIVVSFVWWFAALPLFVILQEAIHDRWMLQETSREWAYMGIAAAASFLPVAGTLLWLWKKWEPFPWSALAGLAAWSLLAAWYGGQLTLNLLNHSSAVPGQPAEFKIIGHQRTTVILRIVGEDYDGTTFTCGNSEWSSHYRSETGTAPGHVYRGRLGLLWGEFKDK